MLLTKYGSIERWSCGEDLVINNIIEYFYKYQLCKLSLALTDSFPQMQLLYICIWWHLYSAEYHIVSIRDRGGLGFLALNSHSKISILLTDWLMPSAKHVSKTTGLILFNSKGHFLPFYPLQQLQCLHHGPTNSFLLRRFHMWYMLVQTWSMVTALLSKALLILSFFKITGNEV